MFPRVSSILCFWMPRVALLRLLRWLCCEHVVSFVLRDVTGSYVGVRRLFVAGSAVLRLYKVLDGLSSDGEARGPRPASGLSASSKLKCGDQDQGKRERSCIVGQF